MKNLPEQHWALQPIPKPAVEWYEKSLAYQQTLTKPPGSLGKLETLSAQFCAWQETLTPVLADIQVAVFAGDQGVAAQGVSSFPQSVTAQMVKNFVQGGAAVCVLAKQHEAALSVVNVGVIGGAIDGAFNACVCEGTEDFTQASALTYAQALESLEVGKVQVESAPKAHLNIAGEMGIGNSTVAAALFAAELNLSSAMVVGPGTGLDAKGVTHKAGVVSRGLAFHDASHLTPWQRLCVFGGAELVALVGYYLASGLRGIPAAVDGYICTAAAMMAMRINPTIKPWLVFAHYSAEPAHKKIVERLQVSPLIDLGLRLGEASGAVLIIPLLRSALGLHNTMATFESAGVSTGVGLA